MYCLVTVIDTIAVNVIQQVQFTTIFLITTHPQNRLKQAELFGYQNDILFKRASAYLNSIKEIMSVCDKSASLVMGTLLEETVSKVTEENEDAQKLGFLVKRPATFTVSSDSADCVNKTVFNVHCSIDLKWYVFSSSLFSLRTLRT